MKTFPFSNTCLEKSESSYETKHSNVWRKKNYKNKCNQPHTSVSNYDPGHPVCILHKRNITIRET